jgi:probable rRNA maturation factor|tara:strand:- start:111 stop:578 length:468 start_codon:yes stop_codon:yes gene_type:complete
MIKINVLVGNKAWEKHIKKPSIYLKKKLKKIENEISLFKKNKLTFTLLLSGNEEIKKLNKKFRKKNKITDVLSFPFHEKKLLYKLMKNNNKNIYLGDIIINLNKIIKTNEKENFLNIFDKIWIHGLVHLLGHKHKLNKDFFIMQKLENKIFKSLQ